MGPKPEGAAGLVPVSLGCCKTVGSAEVAAVPGDLAAAGADPGRSSKMCAVKEQLRQR